MSKHKHYNINDYIKNENITSLAIDTHCHLDRFENSEKIVSSMEEFGLKKIITMAGDYGVINFAREISSKFKNVFYAVGLHPYDIDGYNEDYENFIKSLAGDKNFVAIGEIGLDYYRENSEEEKRAQKEVMLAQIKLASELNKPICMHIRNAHEDAIKLLNENKQFLKAGGVIHCFSGSALHAEEYLKLGFHISFAGNISYKMKEGEIDLTKSLKAVPLDKLLIETDAPFLSPMPYRGAENQPKMVVVTAEFIANTLCIDVNKLIEITTKNAERLFNLNK